MLRNTLPALLLVLVAGLSTEARAEDCTHALTVRGGVAYDPDTGAVEVNRRRHPQEKP